MCRYTVVSLSLCCLLVTASCGSSSTASPKSSEAGDTPQSDASPSEDSATDPDGSIEDSTQSDGSPTPDTELSDSRAAADTRPTDSEESDTEESDVEESDVEAGDTMQGSDTASGCAYVCNIDCPCKKDFDGCDLPECESSSCQQILTEANQLLADAAQGCTASSQCMMFDYPVCGTFGCFQGPVNTSLNLQPLNLIAQQGVEEQCSGFHCGCMLPDAPTVCLDQSCVSCENASACTDCNQLTTLIKEEAAFHAKGCESDEDCGLSIVDQCSMGPQIVCHGYAYNQSKGPGKVLELMSLFTSPENECPWSQCDCESSAVHCNQGICVPGMSPQ